MYVERDDDEKGDYGDGEVEPTTVTEQCGEEFDQKAPHTAISPNSTETHPTPTSFSVFTGTILSLSAAKGDGRKAGLSAQVAAVRRPPE